MLYIWMEVAMQGKLSLFSFYLLQVHICHRICYYVCCCLSPGSLRVSGNEEGRSAPSLFFCLGSQSPDNNLVFIYNLFADTNERRQRQIYTNIKAHPLISERDVHTSFGIDTNKIFFSFLNNKLVCVRECQWKTVGRRERRMRLKASDTWLTKGKKFTGVIFYRLAKECYFYHAGAGRVQCFSCGETPRRHSFTCCRHALNVPLHLCPGVRLRPQVQVIAQEEDPRSNYDVLSNWKWIQE